jgi:hypothetical protein
MRTAAGITDIVDITPPAEQRECGPLVPQFALTWFAAGSS